MNSSLGYSYVPKKILRKVPVYNRDCPNCKLQSGLPLPYQPQIPDPILRCTECQTIFKPFIVKYNEFIDYE